MESVWWLGYRLGEPGSESRSGQRIHLQNFHTGSGSHPLTCLRGKGGALSAWVKWPGHEAGHSLPCSPHVKICGARQTSTPQICLHDVCRCNCSFMYLPCLSPDQGSYYAGCRADWVTALHDLLQQNLETNTWNLYPFSVHWTILGSYILGATSILNASVKNKVVHSLLCCITHRLNQGIL